MGLSNSLTACPFTPMALYHNQANLVYHSNSKITLNFRTFYGISGLIQGDFGGIHRILGLNLGWGIHYFGNRLYQESRLLLAGAVPITNTTALGLGMTLYHLSITGYGQTVTTGVNVSVSSRLSDQFHYGAMIRNINRPGIGQTGDKIPQSLDLGICYLPVEELFVTLAFYKENRFRPEIRSGIGYSPIPLIVFRTGLEDRFESFSMGFGIKLTKFRFDYAIALHPVLNMSHAISVVVDL